ncbi:hypothetical protein RSW97_25660, partial [Escherichia coli]|nr:hypothetical protein [Escherichia coli]
TTGAFQRVQKGPRLADDLTRPIHSQQVADFAKPWQECNRSASATILQKRGFPSFSKLARPLQCIWHPATERTETDAIREFSPCSPP